MAGQQQQQQRQHPPSNSNALPVNLAYLQPAGPGISTMIGENENEKVVVCFFSTTTSTDHRAIHPYSLSTINCRIKLKLSVRHNSLKITRFQRDQNTAPASIFLTRFNGSMSQLFYIPSINQIQLTFRLTDELKSMGTASTSTSTSTSTSPTKTNASTWFSDSSLTDTETASHSLGSISVVKIIIGVTDNALASGLVQSFQAAFGRVQVSNRLNKSWFRAVWESAKAKVAHSPNDKQARLEFTYAYALLYGSGQVRRADKEAWDRRHLSLNQRGRE